MSAFSSLWPYLAESAISGSAAIVFVLLLRPVLRRWLGARAVHALWLVVLLRLFIPWTPHAAIALPPAPDPVSAAPKVSVHAYVLDEPAAIFDGAKTPARVSNSLQGETVSIAGPLMIIWIAGFLVVFGVSLARASNAGALLRRAREVPADSAAYRVLESLCIRGRRLRILESYELKSPALCGLIRPAILLPPGWSDALSADELRCVLLHEAGHHLRHDVLWRWGFLVARAVHWFNPLVWLAEREMRLDQELACDEWVLARGNGVDVESYGRALLQACKVASERRLAGPAYATMAESAAGLARRIRWLAPVKPLGWRSVLVTALLGVGMMAVGPARTHAGSSLLKREAVSPTPTPLAEPSSAAFTLASTPAPVSAPEPSAPDPAASSATAPVESKPSADDSAAFVEIEAKFVELSEGAMKGLKAKLPESVQGDDALQVKSILDDASYQSMIRGLSQLKGADLLSAPRVGTKSGQRAVIEIIREFRYPTEMAVPEDGSGIVRPTAFETRNTGVTLEAIPSVLADGRIEMELAPSVVEFAGFINLGASRPPRKSLKGDALEEMIKSPATGHIINQPIFDTRRVTTSVTIYPDQTILLGGLRRSDTQQVTDTSKRVVNGRIVSTTKTSTQKVKSSLFIFVKAHLLTKEEAAARKPKEKAAIRPVGQVARPETDPTATEKRDLPVATPAPDRPGFVISPYAPEAGLVDVRGLRRDRK